MGISHRLALPSVTLRAGWSIGMPGIRGGSVSAASASVASSSPVRTSMAATISGGRPGTGGKNRSTVIAIGRGMRAEVPLTGLSLDP